ncbi:MAG: hypothetical protein V4622_10100 [Bacteroidota bacterium]
MKKLLLFAGASLFILSSCGESEEVTNCKIHYCNLKKLTERSEKGEDVSDEIATTSLMLNTNIKHATENGDSDINEILKNCDCSKIKN